MSASASASPPTARRRAAPADPYKTPSALAWRNVMIAGLNAGIEQGLFGPGPGENNWSEIEGLEMASGAVGTGPIFRFTVRDEIPAIAWATENGFDDLTLHVAFWPTADAERWIFCNNARRLAGEAFAQGSLERWQGAFLQPSTDLFAARQERLPILTAVSIEPLDGLFSDRARPAIVEVKA